MKTIALIFATVLATTLPALAQNHQNGPQHGYGYGHQGPPPRQPQMRHRYHEGQNWRGHHLTNRGGHWGYYQPRNGANVFISIPI